MSTSSELFAQAATKTAEAEERYAAAALLTTYNDRLDMLNAFIRTTRMDKHVEEVWTSAAATESREALTRTWTQMLAMQFDLEEEVSTWGREAADLEDEAERLTVSAQRTRAIEDLERLESQSSHASAPGEDCEPDPLLRLDVLIPDPLPGAARYCRGSYS
ncbi:MAG: hypothetical protein S0880_27435 [Actinomycetota bacterium]|nr:hypothetical protein [Actinomycetota bacterium]